MPISSIVFHNGRFKAISYLSSPYATKFQMYSLCVYIIICIIFWWISFIWEIISIFALRVDFLDNFEPK